MARIDQAALPAEQTRPTATVYDTPNVTPESQGAGLAAQAENSAGAAADLVAKYQDSATVAATLDAETAHEKFKTQVLRTPETGLYNLQGKVALQQSKPTLDAIEQNRQDLAAKLQPRARNAFLAKTQAPLSAVREQVENFASQQVDAANASSFTANVATQYDNLSNNFDDPKMRGTIFAEMSKAAQARSVVLLQQGVPPEVVNRQLHAVMVGGVKAVLDRYNDKEDGIGAQQYLASGAREVLGAEAGDYARKAQIAANKQQSDSGAQAIVQATTIPGTPRIDEGAAMAKVNAMPPGPVKDQTMARVEHYVAVGQQVQAQQNAGTFAQLMAAWEKQPPGLRNVADLPLALMDKVDNPANLMTDKRAMFEQLQREDRAHEFNPTPSEAQLQQEGLLVADMAKNPGKYATQTPEEFAFNQRSLLTGAQFAAAQQRHAMIIGSMQGTGSIALPPKVEQLVVKLSKDSGLIGTDDPKMMKPQDLINLATVRDAIRAHEQAWKLGPDGKSKGEPPEKQYLEWLTTEILQKGSVKGGGRLFGDANNVTRAEAMTNPRLVGKPFAVENVKQIPPTDLGQINAALNARGLPATDKARLDLYNARRRQLGVAPAAPPASGGGQPPSDAGDPDVRVANDKAAAGLRDLKSSLRKSRGEE